MSASDFVGSAICLVLLCAAVPLGLIPAIRSARQEARRRRCVSRVLAAHRVMVAAREAEVAPRHPLGWTVRIVDGVPYGLDPLSRSTDRYSRAQCGWMRVGPEEAAEVRKAVVA